MNKTNSANNSMKWSVIPLALAVLTTTAYLIFLERGILKLTGGVFSYPLDDPFIHMQVARMLVNHGTWGVNPSEFGSASSSVLYTLLLTLLFKLFSANTLIPFVINCIAALFLLGAIDRWLLKQQTTTLARTIILQALVFLAPIPILIISGMEHTIQCLFSFLFITAFCEWLESGTPRLPFKIFVYAVVVTGIRYEGLFLIGIACLFLLYFRKLGSAILLGAVSFILIIAFGAYSLSKGSYFLPNSVLLKADSMQFSIKGIASWVMSSMVRKLTTAPIASILPGTGISLTACQRLLILLPLTYLVFQSWLRQRRSYLYYIVILILCLILHLVFASTGWFYRYEAYLIVCAVPILSIIFYKFGGTFLKGKSIPALAMISLTAFMLLSPFVWRSAYGYATAKKACLNIYDQQLQMARFLKEYYHQDTIAANDIGAIAFYNNINVVDLFGLGNIDVARSKKGNYWTSPFLDSLVRARKVKLAIVYDEWYEKSLLNKWTKVATWKIPNNVICGADNVTFYSITKENSDSLNNHLHQFQPSLPPGVSVTYY
jgi:hypothetical protein